MSDMNRSQTHARIIHQLDGVHCNAANNRFTQLPSFYLLKLVSYRVVVRFDLIPCVYRKENRIKFKANMNAIPTFLHKFGKTSRSKIYPNSVKIHTLSYIIIIKIKINKIELNTPHIVNQ